MDKNFIIIGAIAFVGFATIIYCQIKSWKEIRRNLDEYENFLN